jgi:hypothetical protein
MSSRIVRGKTVKVAYLFQFMGGEAYYAALLDNGQYRIGITGEFCLDVPATHSAHGVIASLMVEPHTLDRILDIATGLLRPYFPHKF